MGSVHDPRWDNIDEETGPTTGLKAARDVLPAGDWPSADRAGSISLVFDQRHRRRLKMCMDDGREFLLDLPKAVALEHGDGLKLDDGSIVEVLAAPEDLVEVRAHDATHLLRLAWHIGNRHLPAMIRPDVVFIRPDHVIEDMLRGLGGHVCHVTAPFQPEGGAYKNSGQGHSLSHGHGHGHSHDHNHDHKHGHDHEH